jgi:hypothetical protein
VNPGPPTGVDAPSGTRQLLPMTRLLLGVFSVLTALAVLALFVLAGNTEQTFAWTIKPPLTAALLGAGYGAGFLLVVLSLRATAWVDVRVPFLTIFVYVLLTLLATLLHLDRLHFAGEFAGLSFLAKAAAWFWLTVYVVLPAAMLVALARQERMTGSDPPATHPVPVVLRVALGVESVVLLVVGALLFVRPATAMVVWSWPLTPFTGRIVAAWLLAFGVATAVAALGGDLVRLRTSAIAYTAFGCLVLVAVLRYLGTVEWAGPAAWVFLVFAVAVLVTGAAGWWGASAVRSRG